MAKSRKKVFPKPPVQLNETNANLKGIYYSTKEKGSNINDKQLHELVNLRKKLGML
jgi:hypothetical protein